MQPSAPYIPRDLRIADFDYPLPDERIARHPLPDRDRCLLLVSEPSGEILDSVFYDLPELIAGEGMTVFNNTKVIHARVPFRRVTGAAIEIFLLEPMVPNDYLLNFQASGEVVWSCMVGNLKKWKEARLERELVWEDGRKTLLTAELGATAGGNARSITFRWDNPELTFASIIENAGNIPIPPYLKRESEKTDETDYQTVYSKIKGSVAAPTAGLHFTPELLARLSDAGQQLREVTLHVGAGTFQPVKSDTIGDHPMHTELFSVEASFLRELAEAVERSRREHEYFITAVGTTSVRTLETLPYLGRKVSERGALEVRPEDEMKSEEEKESERLHLGQWEAYERPLDRERTSEYLLALADEADRVGNGHMTASTAIMIAPGFSWNIVGRMVTNFHQPSSTLLLLVSSFLERNGGLGSQKSEVGSQKDSETLQWRRLYDHALRGSYRFLSYGDACLLYPLK